MIPMQEMDHKQGMCWSQGMFPAQLIMNLISLRLWKPVDCPMITQIQVHLKWRPHEADTWLKLCLQMLPVLKLYIQKIRKGCYVIYPSQPTTMHVLDKCGQKTNDDPLIIKGPGVTTVSLTRDRFVRTVEELCSTKPVNASALSNDHPFTNLWETDVTNSKCVTNKIFKNISCVGVSNMGSQKLMKMNGKNSDDDENPKLWEFFFQQCDNYNS